jgi:glycosyltransferase involved in cell wall biosynthesis
VIACYAPFGCHRLGRLPASTVRILIDYRPALRQRSGVGEYIHRLTQALVEVSGAQDCIALFASSWKDRLAPTAVLGTTAIDSRVPARLLTRLWHQAAWPPVEWLAGKWDIVHSSRPTLVPTSQAARVITIHDLDFIDHPERSQAEFRGDYGRLVQQHARQADHVVVISAYTAGEVQSRLGVPQSRMTVCRPGAPAWTPREQAPRDSYVLFVGTLEPRKNVGLLLDAYSLLLTRGRPVPRLMLAGRAVEESRPWLEAIERPPLAGYVMHAGYVPDEAREGLYKGAALVVLPSFNEGFGLPVLEAMTAGVPVVAANRGAIPEVLGDAGLLVEPDDAEGLADAIERLLTQPMLGDTLQKRGVRRARQFDWREAARALRGGYEKAMANHRLGARLVP